MSKKNKFTGVAEAIKERRGDGSGEQTSERTSTEQTTKGQGASTPTTPKRRGRPKGGKRNNPEFQQVTLYLPTAVYSALQDELKARRGKGGYQGPRDVSDLLGSLAASWLENEANSR